MPQSTLPVMSVVRKTGSEKFHCKSNALDIDLLGFWQWSSSDLVSNALRGRLAEFLVASALGISNGVRTEWDAFDLKTQNGRKLEVKSAAYLQTWSHKALSRISFDIAPTRYWDAVSNRLAADVRRQSDLYIFALLFPCDKQTLDPMDVSQWDFIILPTSDLDKRAATQKSISLSRLLLLNPVRCSFQKLRDEIDLMDSILLGNLPTGIFPPSCNVTTM